MQFNIHETHKKSSGIYIIKNSINSKIYVGSSVNLGKRYREHKSRLKTGVNKVLQLQDLANIHGLDILSFELLELCNIDVLFEREQFYLDLLKPFGNRGFNRSEFSTSALGVKQTEETKRKIYKTKVATGTWSAIEVRDEVRKEKLKIQQQKAKERLKSKRRENPLFNIKSEAHLKNISIAMKGNQNGIGAKHSPESVQRRAEKIKDTRKVLQLDMMGTLIKEWDNQYEVYTTLGIDKRNLNATLHGKQKSNHGYKWCFKNEP